MLKVRALACGLGLSVLAGTLAACRREEERPRAGAPVAASALPAASGATSLSPLLGGGDAGASPLSSASARVQPRGALVPKAGERIAIPAARFWAGSMSGDEGRDPRAEAAALAVSLTAYAIDRLPYPNDPAEAPRTDVTAKDAARLCAARGQRLCTELEWEYACKGAGGDDYATGAAWDAICATEPARCGSALGVVGMGAMREWTASEVATLDTTLGSTTPSGVPQGRTPSGVSQGLRRGEDDRSLVTVRGAAPSAEAAEHRCARRSGVQPVSHTRDLGFRCCTGAVNRASVPAPKLGPAARKFALEPTEVAEVFATIPQLASVRQSIRYFVEPEDTTTILKRRGGQTLADPEGFTLTTSPLLWNPAPGEEVVVILGHGPKDSFIVALYRLPDNRYRLASSLLLVNDLGPFALAFHPEVRERLVWSSCWKCAGEGGSVSLRDGRRVIIVQQ